MQSVATFRAIGHRPIVGTACAPVLLRVAPSSRRFVGRNAVDRHLRSAEKETQRMSNEPSTGKQMMETADDMRRAGTIPLFPGTFVSLPLSKYPKSPTEFIKYQFHRSKSWFSTMFLLLGIKLDSMGASWTTRPRFKAHRGQIAPTAKAMYRELLEAFAAEDKTTIKKLCTPAFAEKFIYAIDRRKKTERVNWQLVKYKQPLIYPKLMSHMIATPNPRDKTNMIEQAVVAISSLQRMSKSKKPNGELIAGSEKKQDSLEYVVLWRNIKSTTWEKSAWSIWGTTEPTTLDSIAEAARHWEKERAKMAGWKSD